MQVVEKQDPSLLWRPQDPQSTRTHHFRRKINTRHNLSLRTYEELWRWSTENIGDFWDAVWDEASVIGTKGDHKVVVDENAAPSDNPAWFPGAKLNWAQNQLRCRSNKVAIIQATEPIPQASADYIKITYAELYNATSDAVSALLSLGIKAGDRVASYSTNCIENVVACLAAVAIGAIWVSAASDFGPLGVLERFEQVAPKVIFSVDKVVYNGKIHDHAPKLRELLEGLAVKNLSPKAVVIIPSPLDSQAQDPGWGSTEDWISWLAFILKGRENTHGRDRDGEIEWYQAPFDWPLWILFSSGTTGKPKSIVHRSGGMLLQALKEFVICADLKEDDVFFYYTTTGWMMWNFLIGGLSLGCTLVLYDGSPLKNPSILWKFTDELGISIFGTSAKYIEQLSKGYRPKEHHSLKTLRHVYSTGSPLAPTSFDFVYNHIKSDVLLASITGGTDICSLFAGFSSALPVYRGEIQCRMLGMAIQAFGPDGKAVEPGAEGELVCTKPFPCQPLGFWPLEGVGVPQELVNEASSRHRAAYFGGMWPGVWYHGDHVIISKSREHNGGGVVMLGRSDGVLNPGGIRFGSAEIYQVLESCFGDDQGREDEMTILDSLVVGQLIEGGSDERVICFVKLPDGAALGDRLRRAIASEIRAKRTARHVPAEIVQVREVPYTLNGKKVEVPVRKILNGGAISVINLSTLKNPDCLEEYASVGERLRSGAR